MESFDGKQIQSPGLLLLVRSLKGAPLACLVVLRLAGRPAPAAWLGSLTGYSPHTIAQALDALQALGLAYPDERRSNWRLSPQARGLDLWPSGDEPAAGVPASGIPAAGIPAPGYPVPGNPTPGAPAPPGQAHAAPRVPPSAAGIPASGIPAAAGYPAAVPGIPAAGDPGSDRDFCHTLSTPASANLHFQDSEAAAGDSGRRRAKRGRRRLNRPSPGGPPSGFPPPAGPELANVQRQASAACDNLQPVSPPALDPAVLLALRQAGIGEPTASRLAAMAHVDLEYVQAHVRRARRESTPVALLIHRMRAGDPAPAMLEKPGERYISGEYAEFVVH